MFHELAFATTGMTVGALASIKVTFFDASGLPMTFLLNPVQAPDTNPGVGQVNTASGDAVGFAVLDTFDLVLGQASHEFLGANVQVASLSKLMSECTNAGNLLVAGSGSALWPIGDTSTELARKALDPDTFVPKGACGVLIEASATNTYTLRLARVGLSKSQASALHGAAPWANQVAKTWAQLAPVSYPAGAQISGDETILAFFKTLAPGERVYIGKHIEAPIPSILQEL